jgi:hypothetical protein
MTESTEPKLWPKRIAGHHFERDIGGVQCTACHRRWVDIRNAGEVDIGQGDIAHYGTLTSGEYSEICAQREREDALFAAAFESLSRA